MKKLLLPLLAVLILISCDEESSLNPVLKENIAENSYESGSTNAQKSNKIDVCHKGKIINISINAITAHQDHGDAVDMDGDGYFDIDDPCSETDCDDTDATVNPDATEVTYDGIDNDCDPETLDDDLDQDGFNNDDDCDDTNAEVNPAMEEVCDNGIDDNCNGEIDENCGDPCLDEAINQVSALIQGLGGTNLSPTITGPNTFLIFWSSGRDGRSCIETTAEVTGDLETGCGYTNLHHENKPCQ
jgi:hypothetical protein